MTVFDGGGRAPEGQWAPYVRLHAILNQKCFELTHDGIAHFTRKSGGFAISFSVRG